MKNAIYIVIILIGNLVATGNSYGEDGTVICTLTTNIVFSAYNPYDATIEKANGSLKVVCANNGTSSKSLIYVVTLSPGSSGNQTARLVQNGINTVSYNLFKDNTLTQILGDGNSSTYTISNNQTLSIKHSNTDNYIIYGSIPVQPLSKIMTYTDTITATLTYSY